MLTVRNPSKFIRVLVFICFIVLSTGSYAQLKIGDNPTSIQKSSILELESTRQGLLLPRLADTAAINMLTPPDGMIIFLNTDKSLRLRSNGQWKKIADFSEAASNWSLNGNSGTDSALNFIGTLDGKPLVMKTNGANRLIISSDGNVGIGTTNPSARLNVDGSVKLQNLATGTSELDVLVLAADGSVYKRSMSSSAFENAIKSINGIQRQSLSVTAAASDTSNNVLVQSRDADSTVAIYLPVQNGSAGAAKPYGFLTYSDWLKIGNSIQEITIGAVANTSNAFGASISATDSLRTITLHPADATNPGLLTAVAQQIGGDKTFVGNTTMNGSLQLNSLANNTSSDSILVVNNGAVEKRKVSATAFKDAIISMNNNRDTVQTIAFRNSGTDLTVSTNGTDSIYLNVPDASITNRGVVTKDAQQFGGVKTFQDSLNASTSILVGTTGNANSTMQLNGSLSMSIKAVNANYALTADDNTLLANTTSSAITVTLPSPSNIAGRIYTIKKIGTGGLDNELIISPGAATIDDGSSYTIYNDWTYVTLQTDGSNWYVIKK